MSESVTEATSFAVVMAATESSDAVATTLASLGSCRVIVAYDPVRVDGTRLSCEAIKGPPGAGAHHLRHLGMSLVQETIVIFTEDSCIAVPGWIAAWRAGFADRSVTAATGPVELPPGGSRVDQAVFFCEYAPFLTGRFQPARLAGNNFAVRTSALDRTSTEIHESDVARSAGFVRFLPEAAIIHGRRYRLGAAIRDRLRFGYDYGRLRSGSASVANRAAYVGLGPAMLASQIARLAWTLSRKRRGGSAIMSSGVLTLGLLMTWSVGEWLGWVAGGDHRSVRKPGEKEARWPSRKSARRSTQ